MIVRNLKMKKMSLMMSWKMRRMMMMKKIIFALLFAIVAYLPLFFIAIPTFLSYLAVISPISSPYPPTTLSPSPPSTFPPPIPASTSTSPPLPSSVATSSAPLLFASYSL